MKPRCDPATRGSQLCMLIIRWSSWAWTTGVPHPVEAPGAPQSSLEDTVRRRRCCLQRAREEDRGRCKAVSSSSRGVMSASCLAFRSIVLIITLTSSEFFSLPCSQIGLIDVLSQRDITCVLMNRLMRIFRFISFSFCVLLSRGLSTGSRK